MVAGGLPTIQVLLDDGTGTFPYDITTYARLVEGYTCKRGRQDELSSVTAGDFTLTLDNTDGRFTLGSTIIATPSPITMDQKIRVKVTPSGGSAVTRFTQTVNTWPVEWPDGSDQFSKASIAGVDVQAKAERQTLLSVIQQEVGEDSPVAYYTLGEPAGATSAADTSGNQAPALTPIGTGAAVVFGTDTGPTTDGLTAATFAGGQYLTATLSATPGAIEFWFATTTNDATVRPLVWPLAILSGQLYDANLHTSLGAVADGLNHDVVINGTTVYLDGVSVGTGLSGPQDAVLRVGGGSSGAGAGVFIGSMAHVVAYSGALSAARITAHYSAGSTGFAGESGTARLTRLFGYAGIPIGTFDTSLTNVAFVDFTGSSVMSAVQDVVDAEFGLTYINGSGSADFHNRNRPVAKTAPDVTIDANFLAEGTQFVVDMQGVINYFETTAAGTSVTQVVRNTVSENGDGTATHPGHGRYGQSKTYLVQTDAEALDRANWIVATHAEPLPRVGSLAFDVLTMTAAQQAQMLTLEADSWLQVTGLPGQTPGGTTANFVVEGWSEALNAGEWTLTVNAANRAVAAPTPWILDDTTYSVLDSTTKLYV
jgi:hypothetical protein